MGENGAEDVYKDVRYSYRFIHFREVAGTWCIYFQVEFLKGLVNLRYLVSFLLTEKNQIRGMLRLMRENYERGRTKVSKLAEDQRLEREAGLTQQAT